MTATPATILGSEVHMMVSHHTGRTYRITIGLPLGYSGSLGEGEPFDNAPARWPVVYALDGNWCFGLITDMIRPMAWCGSTTDAIVVGIGYAYAEDTDPIETFREWSARRDLDLTPIRDEAAEQSEERANKRPSPTGDALHFLQFIRNELIPFIEQTYRADPSRRMLVGHSYGGLFALFSMFEAPDLFDTLIIGSPSLSYGNRYMFQREEAFAQEHKRLPATVYLYVGDLEEGPTVSTLTNTLRFAAILQSRNYDGFALVKHVFQGQDHCAVATPGFQAGLKLALKLKRESGQ